MAIVSNATHDRKHADTALETYVTITLTGSYQILNYIFILRVKILFGIQLSFFN